MPPKAEAEEEFEDIDDEEDSDKKSKDWLASFGIRHLFEWCSEAIFSKYGTIFLSMILDNQHIFLLDLKMSWNQIGGL